MDTNKDFLGANLELRVLGGHQGGARAPLETGIACVLAVTAEGYAEGADIVLRDETGAARVRVTPGLLDASVEVLEGEVQIAGETVRSGTESTWTMRTPLKIGGSVVAFGPAHEENWDAAAQPEIDNSYPTLTEVRPAPKRRLRPELVLAAIGGVLTIGCAVALWSGSGAAEPPTVLATAEDAVTQLTEALAASEFAALEVRQDALGRITLTGRLATLAERARLDAWLAERQQNLKVSVAVDEAIVHQVTEVFRINNIAVKAKVVGPGRVAAEAAEPDAQRLARAEEVVRRDVTGLASLTVENKATPAPPPGPPMVEDPNKRIASVVAGSPAYIVTVDGARYFEGALLPSGHRITAIAAQTVTVERDGHPIKLNF